MESLKSKFDFKKSLTEAEIEQAKKSRLINYITNMIFFGLSIILITVGILYLTGFKFEYSFNRFSSNLIAAIFISFGSVIFILSILNVVLIQLNRPIFVLITSSFILILFLTLLGLGIWGLVVSSEDFIIEETRINMLESFKSYDEKKSDRYETLKINWLQQKFNCCGIQSYSDWRSYYLYGGQFNPTNYIDQWTINNNLPYMDHVPDSCCINQIYNCGKMYFNGQMSNSIDRNSVIYTKGCLFNFVDQFSRHIMFLAGLSVGVASVGIIAWIILIFFLVILKVRS